MRNKKVLKWMLALILGIWIIVSIFFYFQHRIQVETYPIGKYIEFKNFNVLVKNIERYNFEQNHNNYSYYILSLNLPLKIRKAVLKIQYFYSFPYHIDNKTLKYDLNCEVIFDKDIIDAESVGNLIDENFSITFYDNVLGSHTKPTNYTQTRSSSNNIIYHTYDGDWSPNYKDEVSIINKENGEEYIVQFDKQFLINNYSYLNPRLFDRQKESSDIIRKFIQNYYKEDMDYSQLNINNEYLENFPWNRLNQYENFLTDNYEFSYLGPHMNNEQVFIMKVIDNQYSFSINELEFYMVYNNFGWQIIDVK